MRTGKGTIIGKVIDVNGSKWLLLGKPARCSRSSAEIRSLKIPQREFPATTARSSDRRLQPGYRCSQATREFHILSDAIMSTRMKDIAKDLGVSVITISKVLRNHPDVGDETRKRVLARVKELDYRPNLAARSLVTGRTYLVGLVVPDLLHPFFAEIAKSLSDVLRESGYYLIVSSSEEDPELEEQEINHLLARRLDILIIASCRSTVDLFFRIEKQKTPYVLIDRGCPVSPQTSLA